MQTPNFNGPGKEKIVTTNAASPAPNGRAAQNQQPQGVAATLGENWQQQIKEMLQPAIASIQQQVAQAAEQQLEPLRSRIQQLAEQQLTGALPDTLQQESPKSPRKDEGAPVEKRDSSDQQSASLGEKVRPGGNSQQQRTSGLRSLTLAPTAQLPSQPSWEEESALQRWGETLEGAALIVLALGEVLEGLALLLQALGLVVSGKPSPQQEQEPHPHEEEAGEAPAREEREEPSLVQKVGDTVAGGVSSLKQTVSQVGSGSSAQQGLEGALASLPQWGRILEHASALMQALGDSTSSRQDGLSTLKKWGPIVKHGTPLVKELGQVLGGGPSSQRGKGNIQRWGQILERASSVIQALGDSSSQKQEKDKSSEQEQKGKSSSSQAQEDESSSKQKSGGVSSVLKDLAGGSSSQSKEGGGSSLVDALTGEASPLQMLREFSKRQQGPGGLAPKGPIGRKPPPGPLRRDRIPNAG